MRNTGENDMAYHNDDDLLQESEAIPLIDQDPRHEGNEIIPRVKSWPTRNMQSNVWRSTHLFTILTAATAILLVTTFSSGMVAFTSALSKKSWENTTRISIVDIKKLRQPSLYLGLERVPEIKTKGLTFGSSYNLESGPELTDMGRKRLGRVSSLYPDTKFGQDGWVFMTETDHMIFNFTIPSGPGVNCAFHASFPSRRIIAASDTLLTLEYDPPSTGDPQLRHSLSSEPTITFTALRNNPTLHLEDLTWSTRPPPVRTLGSLIADYGSTSDSKPFPCPSSDEWVLVEAGCEGRGCRVEYNHLDSVEGEESIGLSLRRL
ncbi:hypothetical protein BDY19DRAFT_993082 [Irpex rosettiformis]|uniref:Uncharacterized protein n=1 Tax=Irpex rosettiformis TaxID=378272 RepID=A0ACB8U522_9APHY|nr:hypothetical protein BDY19DRAFT_993082 [Irpex rosettiformis]